MTLAALIATHPSAATATDAEVLAWLQETVTVQGRASANSLRAWAAAAGRRARLARAAVPASDGSTDAVASLAQTAIDIVRGVEGLDTADPRLPPLLDAMEAAGLLVGSDRADLMACGATQAPRWQATGVKGGEITLAHVAEARS